MTLRDQLRAAEARADHWQRLAEMLREISDTGREDLWERAMKAEAFIRSLGYSPCNIPACNCGSWHRNAPDR
jgi:hypothetical protein